MLRLNWAFADVSKVAALLALGMALAFSGPSRAAEEATLYDRLPRQDRREPEAGYGLIEDQSEVWITRSGTRNDHNNFHAKIRFFAKRRNDAY